MAKDYYSILGVDKSADTKIIKKKFRELAKKYHPDINKEEGTEEKFKEIQEAYEVLSDENKRYQYDNYGTSGFDNVFENNYQQYSYSDINSNFKFFDLKEWFSSLSLLKKVLLILVSIVLIIVIIWLAFWAIIIYFIFKLVTIIINLILGGKNGR